MPTPYARCRKNTPLRSRVRRRFPRPRTRRRVGQAQMRVCVLRFGCAADAIDRRVRWRSSRSVSVRARALPRHGRNAIERARLHGAEPLARRVASPMRCGMSGDPERRCPGSRPGVEIVLELATRARSPGMAVSLVLCATANSRRGRRRGQPRRVRLPGAELADVVAAVTPPPTITIVSSLPLRYLRTCRPPSTTIVSPVNGRVENEQHGARDVRLPWRSNGVVSEMRGILC